ncbi:hypothetical protein ACRALDRAFT_1043046 [Sodiomyces alcalophilus JCM 7366]|uniref:uncharacterized protein n=1 Tax=Sodiomyces alcalophilus JCM 7366 TaxID=591952 RepID=UPI0039B5B5C5
MSSSAASAQTEVSATAFVFGITFTLAAVPLFPLFRRHGIRVFRDGLRLALTIFFCSAALWALVGFATILLDPTSRIGCQVIIVFASAFDQLARLALLQYFVWAINQNQDRKSAADTLIPQALLALRFLVGAVHVGFQRPQLGLVCQTHPEWMAVGITVAATDAVLAAVLLLRAFLTGHANDVRSGGPGARRSKAIFRVMAGFALWTGASVPMFLGIETTGLALRTALPAGALSILLVLVSLSVDHLALSRSDISTLAQDESPGGMSTRRRDLSSSDSNFPPSRFEELKDGNTASATADPEGRPDIGRGFSASEMFGKAAGVTTTVVGAGTRAIPDQQQTKPKRNIFGRKVSAASENSGQIVISNPVIQQSSSEDSPFRRIPTVDLATAAKNERDRRDMATLQNPDSLVAQRPAPQPPAITPEEIMRRNHSIKRKQIAPQPSEGSLLSTTAITATSTQLSPGVEQIRRRSPRQSPKDFFPLEEQEMPSTALQHPRVPPPLPAQESRIGAQPSDYAKMAPVSAKRQTIASQKAVTSTAPESSAAYPATPTRRRHSQTAATGSSPPRPPSRAESSIRPDLPATWPRQPSVRATIRPSRTQPSPAQNVLPNTSSSQRSQTRRPAVGLPSNPRAQSMKSFMDTDAAAHPTVLFLNKIQYDDPRAVQNIIAEATATEQKTAPSTTAGLSGQAPKQRESIIHRPRPIPRQSEKDRQLFPSEQSPGRHRRSRSGGSLIGRRSILRSDPGSPTSLPPLPPLPKTAGVPGRPLPNDTRSMTFDEKMDFFFPPSPRSAMRSSVARDSIPDVPPLPSAYLPDKNTNLESSAVHSPDGSIETSVRALNILETEKPVPRLAEEEGRHVSAFSGDTHATTERNGTSEPGNDYRFAGPMAPSGSNRSSKWSDGSKRRSSQVIPDQQGPMSVFSDVHTRDDEGTTHWGSIYSPVAAVNIKEARCIPKQMYIQQNSDMDREARNPSALNSADGKEVMTTMLDTAAQSHSNTVPTPPQSGEQKIENGPGSAGSHPTGWHHRLGDECATFSARKDRVVSRRMPPPTPLLLNVTSSNAYVIRAAEPSPLDSPQEAYEAIQRQLKDLEEASRASVASDGQKIRLLESLEREMGQQESQWQEMQTGLGRNSISTAETTSRGPSRPISSANAWASPSPSSRMQSLAALGVSMRPDNLHSASRHHSLVLAQLQNHAEHLHPLSASNRHLKPFMVSRAQLSSPTPPDTDESDSEDHDRVEAILRRRDAPVAKLWVPKASHAPATRGNSLWSPEEKRPVEPVAPAELPNQSLRPATRKILEPLAISSSQLWTPKRAVSIKPHAVTIGLWRGAPIPPPSRTPTQKAKVGPVTQRPSRRSKRITHLPDIPESPEPLPNKRDTLGIFRFPWGEVSDNATIQMQPASIMLMPMPGTMSSGGGRMLMTAAPSVGHESSYFEDEYDEGEDDDAISEINENSDDDDFDETTLWEIASLLKSNQVPSKDSLFPPIGHTLPFSPGDSDYGSSEYNEDETDNEQDDGVDFNQYSNTFGFDVDAFPRPPRPSALWEGNAQQRFAPLSFGLPQPDEDTWKGYVVSSVDAPVRHQYQEAEPSIIHSRSLWTLPVSRQSEAVTSNALLWSAPQPASVHTAIAKTKKDLLWSAPPSMTTDESEGLFSPNHKRVSYRSTTAEPAARDMISKRRALDEPLARLPPFSGLWDKPQPVCGRPLWIAGVSSSAAEVPPRMHLGLWVARVQDLTQEPQGLFNPIQKRADYRTTSSEPIGRGVVRKKTRAMDEPTQELPLSSRLWTKSTELTSGLATHTPHLWAPPVATVPSASSEKEVSISLVTPKASFLWVAPAVRDVREPEGLFQAGCGRTVFRTTTAEPAALYMPRKLRPIEEPIQESPASSGLWSQSQRDVKFRDAPRGLWNPPEVTASKVNEPDSRQLISTSASLWSMPTQSLSEDYDGLFQAGRRRTASRTTSAEPAALGMTRRPRVYEDSLPELTSTALWTPGAMTSYEYDWISISSVGPQSPSYASSSGQSSPISETASMKTTSTRASSIVPPRQDVYLSTNSMKTTRPPPLRRQYRPLLAYRADWDAALKEAIAAGAKANTVTAHPFSTLPTRGLWTKPVSATPALPSLLWTSRQSSESSPPSTSPVGGEAEDVETHRLRRKRVNARIHSNSKAEISATVVDVSGQRLWNRWDSEERRKDAVRGNDADWLDSRKQLARFSRVVFRY